MKSQSNQFPKLYAFVLLFLLLVSTHSNAQLKIGTNGNVRLGTETPLSTYKFYVNNQDKSFFGGEITFNPHNHYTVLQIKDTDYDCGLEPALNVSCNLGSSSHQFSKIYGYQIYQNIALVYSDKKLKTNFKNIDTPLDKIVKLKGLKYDYKTEFIDTITNERIKSEIKSKNKNRIGLIAQDVLNIIPEAVVYDSVIETYFLEYNAFIPVIIEAMKEQQSQIEELEAIIKSNEVKSASTQSAPIRDNSNEKNIIDNAATLNQNIPNPFNKNTKIGMYIPSTVSNAILYIYNMQGNQIASYSIIERQYTSITIEGNELDAGMYLYTLIADGEEVDTKRMILTK